MDKGRRKLTGFEELRRVVESVGQSSKRARRLRKAGSFEPFATRSEVKMLEKRIAHIERKLRLEEN